MNKAETAEAIKVMQAYVDGAEIVLRDGNRLSELSSPTWNWAVWDYQVKPKPRTIWVNEYPHPISSLKAHSSKEEADEMGDLPRRVSCTQFREVLDD